MPSENTSGKSSEHEDPMSVQTGSDTSSGNDKTPPGPQTEFPSLIAGNSVSSKKISPVWLNMSNRRRLFLGILVVAITLTASMYLLSQFHAPPQAETVHIFLTTFSFGFNTTDVQNYQESKIYPSPTLTVHKGQQVVIELRTLDFTHGFAIDDFNIHVSIPPGQTITASFLADRIGNFTYYCNVFCGVGHPYMHGIFEVLP